jgi:ABC-type transport system involved in multi-copper enzyme maturation permease subunit
MIRQSRLAHAPLMRKELILRMRTWRTAVTLFTYATLLAVIAIGFLIQQGGPGSNNASLVGIQLFQVLAMCQVILLLFVTPLSTAGAISGERQRQTWDLLLTTRMTAAGIVWSLLVTGLAFDLLLVTVSLPLFGLAFLFGGINGNVALQVCLVTVATVVVLVAVGLFISSLTRRSAHAIVVAYVVALVAGVGLTIVTLYFEDWGVQATGPSGSLPLPPLSPLAQLDPLVAVASALPSASGGSMLGGLDRVRHAFGLPLQMPVWTAYCIIALIVTLFLVTMTCMSLRRSLPRGGPGISA